jgi:hypothetical protein
MAVTIAAFPCMVISFSTGHPLNTPFCANITIIDDVTLENTETFSIALYTDFPEGVVLTRDRSIVEILDNEESMTYLELINCPFLIYILLLL